MKEISDILKSYSEAQEAGKKCALATVVKVEGSSYRQPGARMLVTEDGILTGAISGGCLEGDALRKALLSIYQKQNKLITYNTSNEDSAEIGLQLGCNGIVHILFEFIDEEISNNPIELLRQLEAERKEAVVVTVFSLKRGAKQIGTALFFRKDNPVLHHDIDVLNLISDVKEVLENKKTIVKKLIEENDDEALIEYVKPPISLIIAGAGNDVQPLVKMATILGWKITIQEGRTTHVTKKRFPKADVLRHIKAEQFLENIVVDDRTFFVLMTHNYKYDLAVLKSLFETNCQYIGILGPKSKFNRMLDDLHKEGIVPSEEQLQRVHSPIGLDIGSETAEEIALSIVAEIKAFATERIGTSLRYKKGKIHDEIEYGEEISK
ncbi:xanthine/CO dehydrogenase XdhC/CoxF family maturation factor [Flavobacterium nitrogenifigens]|uniref:Xanthine/CO dehydrogenase XdhC/CoxF family maturation factor n=2 Tax=Flavobacterium TaxID=237 RepID=A0A7W7N6Y1_9FLAO|nr:MULTISPECIES: XdhC/CoxI family protein [Flavobacterium]MBB4802295.1 xanthine/CO dehydrogenase XdhC/CoxF family maturation factor [Flavobacterium nitrogenifigens]MBB6387253.1 xanthine/CO dehydrogenase XdhC/CoxF family maturation factor [Flavobacterium notoginsengisoli]